MNVTLPTTGLTPAGDVFRVARRAIPHDSGPKHVQGSATYIDDIREPAGTLHVAPGFALSAAKGKITRIDLDAVRAYPGVVLVLTAADIPAVNDCSPSIGGDPVFADGEILFHGQVVFAVVAVTRDAARRATRLAIIEVDAETPAVDVEAAVARNSMILPDYEFIKGEPTVAIGRRAGKARGFAPHRLAGTFLSRRTGGAGHPDGGRRSRHSHIDAASDRSAAYHGQGAWAARRGDCRGMPPHGWRVWRARKARRRNGP